MCQIKCKKCIFDCKNFFQRDGKCVNFQEGLSIEEINMEIKYNNIDVKKICKKHRLKFIVMKNMLNQRIILSYKYRYYLMLKINKIKEWDEYKIE